MRTLTFIFSLLLLFIGHHLPAQQYFPQSYTTTTETGIGVYYADYMEGRRTASGEPFSQRAMTCAHKYHPYGTLLKVTRLDNNQSVMVRVNDRGPEDLGVLIDLSKAAAGPLGLLKSGRAQVRLEVVGSSNQNPAPPAETNSAYSPSSYGNDRLTARGVTGNQPVGNVFEIKSLDAYATGFSVQVASYQNRENAMRQIVAIQQKGVANVYLHQTTSGYGYDQKVYYKILVGTYPAREQAASAVAGLRAQYFLDGIVVKLK